MSTKTKTRAAFRRYLNEQDAASRNPLSFRNFAYHQKTRLYGDYLYRQDREKFEVDYQEWLALATNAPEGSGT